MAVGYIVVEIPCQDEMELNRNNEKCSCFFWYKYKTAVQRSIEAIQFADLDLSNGHN